MLFFFNIWSQNPASHSAQIASKMFQNPETMMMTIRICAETIANDSGGLGGLKTACNLLKRVAHHNSSMFLDYEIKQDSSSSKKKTATKVIKSCISVLRNESESDEKATILELLLSLSRINDEIKQTIIARLSQDERQNDSITIVLSEKDPLRHGSEAREHPPGRRGGSQAEDLRLWLLEALAHRLGAQVHGGYPRVHRPRGAVPQGVRR